MKRAWIFFWMLTIVWGSSYLFMRVGVEELPPAQLAFIRISIAAVCMNALMLITKRRYPRDLKTMGALLILGIVNTALPFTLLAWGEQTVESGMTGVLQSITPVFSVVLAHFMFADERITPMKIMGIALGFGGILVLTSRDLAAGGGLGGDLSGEIAILVASLCYGIGGNFSRKLLRERESDTIVVAAVSTTAAAFVAFGLMYTLPLLGERAPIAYTSLSGEMLQVVLMLGFVNTFIAYLMFYEVIARLGASRASMVTYVIPVVAVTLGAIFLDEVIDERLLVGASLIFAGLALVNGWLKRLRPQKPSAATEAQRAVGD